MSTLIEESGVVAVKREVQTMAESTGARVISLNSHAARRLRAQRDTALRDASGRSWISYEDYAVALVDEIEQPRHSRRRFTVGY